MAGKRQTGKAGDNRVDYEPDLNWPYEQERTGWSWKYAV